MRRAVVRALAGLAFGAALVASAPEAAACGACFVPPTDDTVVSGHRMVFSLSKTQTTLYDQISYQGDPSSFAWVLPIHGVVDVGLSADLMFQTLDAATRHQVSAPPRNCPAPPDGCYPPPYGGEDGKGGTGGGSFADASSDAGVTVLSQATVGPYETVQLAASDPEALQTWLADHGYVIPADVQPVVAAYVNEGFGFLALKLVPGAGISSMRPVRVTTPGAGATLPLRMVAGGTGASVPITLWVVAEAAYEPENFPTFTIDDAKLSWDWATYSSNYDALRAAGYQATGGIGWLDESSIAFGEASFAQQIESYVSMGNTDYGGASTDGGAGVDAGDAHANVAADMAALFAGMRPTDVRVTRLRAELPRRALGADLTLHASVSQAEVPLVHQAKISLNEPPCPDYSWCTDAGGYGGSAGSDAGAGEGLGASAPGLDAGGGPTGCAAGRSTRGPNAAGALGALFVAAATIAARRRRAGRRDDRC